MLKFFWGLICISSILQAQVYDTPFDGTVQDSFFIAFKDKEPKSSVVAVFDDCLLLQSPCNSPIDLLQKQSIYFFRWKDRLLFKHESRKYSNSVSGFGVLNPDSFYVVLTQCGREGSEIVTVDIKNQTANSERITALHASSSHFRKIDGQNHILLLEWDDLYLIYNLSSHKLLSTNKRLPQIFNDHANCSFTYPYAFANFLNDSILAVNFTVNPTIYFLHTKYNCYMGSISNPNSSFKNPNLVFDYIHHEIPIPYPESASLPKYIVNYRYFYPFNSFEIDGRTYYYQFSTPPLDVESENDLYEYYSNKRPAHLTIWNEHFEIIHNLFMPHRGYFLDKQGNLFSYSHRETGVMVKFYGPIVQTKSLRTSK